MNQMDEPGKNELLVKVAKLYYEDGFSQSEISDMLGFSRPYISKMIAEAHKTGIVSINIRDSIESETLMERRIRMRFNLLRVFAVPFKATDSASDKVGACGARYLSSILKSNDIVGIGGGNSMMHCANNLPARDDLENVTVVQLDGSMISLNLPTYTQSIPKIIADKMNGNPIFFPVPLFVQDKKIKDALLLDKNIANIVALQSKANIAVFTVGGTGMGRSTNSVQSNFLQSSDLDSMMLQGVVGNIGGHFLKKDGSVYDPELDNRVLSLSLEELRKKEYRICLASGRSKYEGVFAALCGGYINVLIADADMVQALAMMLNAQRNEKA